MNSQESLVDQLRQLVALANQNGLYDAADYIQGKISDTVGATVKPGWKLPEPPVCPTCGAAVTPEAIKDADGWHLMWSAWCPACKSEIEINDPCIDCEWPFVEDYAKCSDFVRLGFAVEVA